MVGSTGSPRTSLRPFGRLKVNVTQVELGFVVVLEFDVDLEAAALKEVAAFHYL